MVDLAYLAYLAETGLTETVTSGIDISIVDSLLEITRTILGMFNVFPLNVFLTAGLVGIGVGIFKKLKRS